MRISALLLGALFVFGCMDSATAPSVADASKVAYDYAIPLLGLPDSTKVSLAADTGKPLLVFYFSPRCPHCQATYPKYQALVHAHSAQGLQGAAIATQVVTVQEVRDFMATQAADLPFFQDAQGKFSTAYGSGYVPLLVLVRADGSFVRYAENTDASWASMQQALDSLPAR